MPEWNDQLQGIALNIAATNSSPLRVLAGPGTGKTFAMKRRVMRLLQEDVPPQRIQALTFTRTAARDISGEIAALGVPGALEVRAGTLHSFCFTVLRKAAVLALTGRVPRPIMTFEQRFLWEDLQKPFGGVNGVRKRILAFGAAWARLQSDEPGWPTDPVDQAFHSALRSWLVFHEAMLVTELVPVTLQYLRNNPLCPERTAFDEVLVDEYQDLNRAEQALIDLLSESSRLTVIGDEDQSIYAFKHAHPDGISTFHNSHIGTHDEQLTECRRCPKRVVSLAAALIANNTTASGRPLTPKADNSDGEVFIVQWPTVADEAAGIAQFVKRRIDGGDVQPGNVLILAPLRTFGYEIRDALRQLDIPAHSFFTEEALEGNPKDLGGSRAQESFTLLTLLASPSDRVALRSWCGFGSSSLAEAGWRRIRAHCESTGIAPREALEQIVKKAITLPFTGHCEARFIALGVLEAQFSTLQGQELVDALFPPGEEWSAQVRQIADAAADPDEPYTAASLLEALRTGITQPELPTDVEYVRVMSLWKSKGLTAQMVIVVGCIQGAIPRLAPPDATVEERQAFVEEQRRLFYVAITRPTRTLVISGATTIDLYVAHKMMIKVQQHGGQGKTLASQFIHELGPAQPAAIAGHQLP